MNKAPKLKLPTLYQKEPIAIVGLGGIFPDAKSIDDFWQNIVSGHNSIREVPPDRWDPLLYFDEDRNSPDKSYTKIGAFVEDFVFKSFEYRIPPTVAIQMDPVQQYALYAAKEALEDANYSSENFPRESCAVVIGNSGGGEKKTEYNRRIYYPFIEEAVKKTNHFKNIKKKDQNSFLDSIEKEYKSDLQNITEDTMPGELPNIIAGRIASVFNLRGMNITSDAACASSLAAIDVAYKGLQAHDYDAAVVGGADRTMDPSTYVKFSKIGALSADGSYPFDARGNGFVMGEGSGMFILKRLSDAVKFNDKIYALIIGVGASSDGKGKGITAPNPIGQELAVKRAYEIAEITPNEVQLVEAHGTSTSVGDKVEVNSLNKVFKHAGVKPQSIKIGSIKSQIGHLKSAAGAAAIIKTVLGIHHKIIPPSINFETPNPNIDWKTSPFVVNTKATEWKVNNNEIRRAGVSSFGFGGTNFHVVLEEYDPNREYSKPKVAQQESTDTQEEIGLSWNEYSARNQEFEKEAILLSARSLNELLEKLENLPQKIPKETISVNPNGQPLITAVQSLKFDSKHNYRLGIALPKLGELKKYAKLADGALQDVGRQGVARARGIFVSEGVPEGKVAFVFPGQGSQYANMIYDLSQKYNIVKNTIEEADKVLEDYLDEPLSSYLFSYGRDRKEVDAGLRQTEITQPAMLTADIAIFRLLTKYGLKPNMVAGHSLGEYAALVAAEVLTFKDALIAVAIRGKAMSEVDVDDKGTMASISGTIEEVEDILKKVDGYVIAANKNSLSQTVISGSTDGIEKAINEFESRGLAAIKLSVSAAFHTEIVEPAAEPLSKYLETIKFKKPKIPITSNVTGDFFPNSPGKIRELLKKQVGSPVEWTSQVKSMNKAGATIFFEVGPKRALSGFVNDIIGERNGFTVACNHPKKGGIQTFNEAIAAAGAIGLNLKSFKANSNIYTPEYRWPQNGKIVQSTTQVAARKDPLFSTQEYPSTKTTSSPVRSEEDSNVIKEFLDQTAQYLKSDTTKIYNYNLNLDNVVVTGIGVGLPGLYKDVFDENNFERIINGENFIDQVPKEKLDGQLERKIVRLIKKSGSEPVFHSPTNYDEVINLAGLSGKFNLVEEFQIGEELADTYDTSTELAIAAGLLALRDAGIPLVRSYKRTTTGSYLPGPWVLPEELQDDTGVIFAAAFPGIDKLSKEIQSFNDQRYVDNSKRLLNDLYTEISRKVGTKNEKDYLLNKISKELSDLEKADNDYHFNRKLLLNVLPMGHSQFAQLIRARGPNTHVNAACASTTQAVGVANDWIRSGRCNRVIVISADNISSDNLFPWLGTGFLASGAATTKSDVKEAALPFDRRREGMIIGMGAAALVIETEAEAQRRGVTPLVEILGTHYANSSFHGTRLDINHVSESVQQFAQQIERAHGLTTDDLAKSMMFMSHETYTPRRGGSAGAEIQALRDTFGPQVSNIIVANTKGFTGHAMGAGIEDVVAIKSMEVGKIPPIANFKEGDEELGPLRLSKGENVSVDYALRLAAGFGSQVALALYKKRSSGNRFGMLYDSWLETLGSKRSDLIKMGKTLRLKDKGMEGLTIETKPVKKVLPKPVVETLPKAITKPSVTLPKATVTPPPKAVASTSSMSTEKSKNKVSSVNVITDITDLLVEKTGYPRDMLEPDLEFESDLGIDSIKAAELFGEVREKYGIERREDINLADLDTINKIASYISDNVDSVSLEEKSVSREHAYNQTSSADTEQIQSDITDLLVLKTGYPRDMLEPDLEFESDLGIDSIKAAELFGEVREQYGIERREDINLAELDTINKITKYISENTGPIESTSVDQGPPKSVPPTVPHAPAKQSKTKTTKPTLSVSKSTDPILLEKVRPIIARETGYPESLLNEMISFRDDLGLNEDAMYSLIAVINEKAGLNINTSNISTINFISDLFGETSIVEPSTIKKEEKIDTKLDDTPIEEIKNEFEIEGGVKFEQVKEVILDLLVDKTGYPRDMLEPDLEFESDLGIDSIKAAELFGEVREKFGIDRSEDINLADLDTITKIASYISSQELSDTTQIAGLVTTKEESITPTSTYRYAIRYNEEKISPVKGTLNGILISRKNKAIDNIAEKFSLGIETSLKTVGNLSEGSTLILVNPTKVSIGSISKLFSFIKSNLDNLDGLILAVKSKKTNITPIHQLNPLQGAIGGLFKSISMEFTGIRAKIIVYEKETQLKQELLNEDVEVAYHKNQRLVVALHSNDLPESTWKLNKQDILLATGGAQGITYEIIKNIASKGSTIILLGRTKLREDAPIIADFSDEELADRKNLLKEELKGKGKKVTPVVLEKEWGIIYKSAQVWKHIKELQNIGANVFYDSVDVSSTKSVNRAMKTLGEEISLDSVTHFIHGAGLEISRPTVTKTQKEFEQVYSVKVDGFENLYKLLNAENLKRVLVFTSVAGRFGNATQADYSAANEYLAKKCRELIESGINATAIDWSAWADVGMATRGSTLTVLSALGLTPIPLKEGVTRAIQEIEHGSEIEVVISGELGGLASKTAWYKGKEHPSLMIDSLDKSELQAFRTISIEKDPYLEDHRIDGKAVLPGVMGMEAIAEMSKDLEGEQVIHLQDVKFKSPIKLPHDKPLDLVITKDEKSSKYIIKSKFIGPDGKQLGGLREHFEMTSVNVARSSGFPSTEKSNLAKVSTLSIMSAKDIYNIFFHGPSYQVIKKLNEITEVSVISTFNRPKKAMFEDKDGVEIDPLAIEAGFQTAGLHLMLTQKQMGLPSGIKQLTVFKLDKVPKYILVQYLRSNDTHSYYDVDIVDNDGNILIKLEEYEAIHTGDLEVPDIKLSKKVK